MHISFLTPEYPHPDLKKSGGIGTSIQNLAKGLAGQGIDVTVFVIGQKKDAILFDTNIRLICIPAKRHKILSWYFERKKSQRIINDYIKQLNINLIEAPDWGGITAFMKFSVPLVIRLHGSDTYFCHLEGRSQNWKYRLLEWKAIKDANYIVSVSEFVADFTKRHFKLKNPIEVVHNVIDTNYFKSTHDFKTGSLLYFGTIIRKKGILHLAHIFNLVVEKNRDATLTVIGKDTIDVILKKSTLSIFKEILTPEAVNRTTFLSEVEYSAIRDLIQYAQVGILPSLAEAFPMTWLEVLSMSRPLVSSNIGWAKELMVEGETGFMVDPKDHQLYAQRIVELICDVDKSKHLGRNARAHIEKHFSLEQGLIKNIEFYHHV
ncbi:glycosyltransferase family 4 protein [Winogradskyella aurantiaca]|uniref:glycosyltransferase family 4 protein n=1 Tax=Winogradskyella aurantiaca TaxID=2219558 RepID=UPI000E1CCD31|nr:glycosyltransferase family 4 protein [Winogradskyella aurantiaca]